MDDVTRKSKSEAGLEGWVCLGCAYLHCICGNVVWICVCPPYECLMLMPAKTKGAGSPATRDRQL